MITEKKIAVTTKTDTPMSKRRAAVLVTQMYADLVARLRYCNLVPDHEYSEAVALAVMALREDPAND